MLLFLLSHGLAGVGSSEIKQRYEVLMRDGARWGYTMLCEAFRVKSLGTSPGPCR